MVRPTSTWLFLFVRGVHTHYSFSNGNVTSTKPKGVLSAAAIAGIAVGIVAVLLVLLFVLFILYRRRRPSNKHRDDTIRISMDVVPSYSIPPSDLQISDAAYHGALYTPVRENFTASSSSDLSITSLMMFPFYICLQTDRSITDSSKSVTTMTWMTETTSEPPPRYSGSMSEIK
jgi:hypothetical protein